MTICKKLRQGSNEGTVNVAILLYDREHGFTKSNTKIHMQKLAELKAATSEMQETHCQLPSSVRSTFLMSFSPDSSKVASTHGDHKIYVCDVRTGKLLHILEGHPRTPWCLAFHPTSNDILASGCLGGEVRVWHLHGGSERWGADQCTVIASLTFHPLDKVLVIATNNQLHFWDWSQPKPFATRETSSVTEKVRFVKFDRLGNRLITGISNVRGTSDRYTSLLSCHNVLERNFRPLSSRSQTPSRRTMLNRIINLYNHRLARHQARTPELSSSEEEALSRARQYAEVETQAHELENLGRRFAAMERVYESLESMTTHITSESNLNTSTRVENPESSESSEELASGEFWRTFQRLRNICSCLERRLQMHHHLQNTEPPSLLDAPFPTTSSNREETRPSSNLSANPYIQSGFLINVLTRIRNSLHFSALTTAIAQDQIQQVRIRITEILGRLANVTSYRARLTNLRQQIFDVAERREQRGEVSTHRQRWDLAHCLWLVEMSLQLTRQMQRILQADYNLAQQHLNANSPFTTFGDNNTVRLEERATETARVDSSMIQNLRSSARETLNRIRNSRFQLMQVNQEIQQFQDNLSAASDTPLLDSLRGNLRPDRASNFTEIPRRDWGTLEEPNEFPFSRISDFVRHSSYSSLLHGAGFNPDAAAHETFSFTHRIQSWDFSKYEVPDIKNPSENVVVKRCMIHNDASVDISQDGQLLVALIPPHSTSSPVFGVYSLKPGSLGDCLCVWGYVSNAISVSLSPLGHYVVVGLASPRPYLSNPEKEAVAQIVRLRPSGKNYVTDHIRSLTQLVNNENRYPHVSLNSVRWLPQSGQGIIYGTNRGCLCICKPTAPMTLKKNKIPKQTSMMQSSSISLGLVRQARFRYSTISTQTSEPLMQTTGTQTPDN